MNNKQQSRHGNKAPKLTVKAFNVAKKAIQAQIEFFGLTPKQVNEILDMVKLTAVMGDEIRLLGNNEELVVLNIVGRDSNGFFYVEEFQVKK